MKFRCLLFAAFLLAACGDDSSSASANDNPESSSSSVKDAGSVYDVTAQTVKDLRDGQTYKTVTIGTQTWMAENLNYAYKGVKYNYNDYTSDSSSWCYVNYASDCDKCGRLYTWAAAMDSAGLVDPAGAGVGCGYRKTCSAGGTVRGICPEGWHLPTKSEWETLFTVVGGISKAGDMLKSTSGWNSGGNGIDEYEFSVLPAGYRDNDGDFNDEGYYAYFWSSTEVSGSYAWYMNFGCSYSDVYEHDSNKDNGFIVRCLKDDP